MSCTSSYYNIWTNGGAEEFCSTEYPREGRARGEASTETSFLSPYLYFIIESQCQKIQFLSGKREDGHVEKVAGQCRLPELHHGPLAHGAMGTDTKLHDAEQPQVAVLMSSKTVFDLICSVISQHHHSGNGQHNFRSFQQQQRKWHRCK